MLQLRLAIHTRMPCVPDLSQLFKRSVHAHPSSCKWVLHLAAAIATSLAALETDDSVDTAEERVRSQRCSAKEDLLA